MFYRRFATNKSEKETASRIQNLASGDTVIDGSNFYYVDDIRRAQELLLQDINCK